MCSSLDGDVILDKRILKFTDLTKKLPSNDKVYFDKDHISEVLEDLNKGDRVIHKNFGVGDVVEISSDIISINFNNSIKKFPYPSVFIEGYIELIS